MPNGLASSFQELGPKRRAAKAACKAVRDYGKKSKISFTEWCCRQVATAVIRPCGAVLCIHSLLEHTDVTIMRLA